MTTTDDSPVAAPAAPAHQARAVRLRGLRKVYGETAVLDGLDLDLARGEFVAVLGPSGTGKTTLLRILAGLERPEDGEVLVPPRRTTVYQEPRLVQPRRVLGNVTLGLPRTAASRAAARRALEEVGLAGRESSWPATLSGGEAQRVALARALVRDPQLLLLDEPFAALDALTRVRMQQLVVRLWREHRPAVLLVTHDVDEALRIAHRVVVLNDGRLAADRPVPGPDDPTARAELRLHLLAQLGVTADGVDSSDAASTPERIRR